MKTVVPESSRFAQILPILNWTIATFFCVFQFYLQVSASLMAKSWSDAFALSPIGVGALSSAFFYTYLLMQVPVGYLNDRFNPRWILSSGALLVGLGCLIMSQTHDYSVALIARAMMGLGSSVAFVSMLYISARWFEPARFTLMVGYSETIGMVGVALSAVVAASMISTIGWRATLVSSGVIAFITLLITLSIVRDKPTRHTYAQGRLPLWQSLIASLREKNVWLAGLFGFCHFSVINGLCSLWGVPFLRNVYQFPLNLSAGMVSMIFYGMALGAPLVGYVSLRMGQRKPVMFTNTIAATSLLLILIYMPHLPKLSFFILFFLLGVSASCYIQCFAITKELTPTPLHGISLAITNLLVMLGAPIFQTVIGALLNSQFFHMAQSVEMNYRLSLIVIPLSFVLAFVLTLGIQETYCRSYRDNAGRSP